MKKSLAILLALIMMLTMIPAFAEGKVARIGSVEYATLDEAIAAAADGDTIEEKLADMLLKGQGIYLIDRYEDELLDLDFDMLCKGLSLFIENGGSSNIEDYDLIDADSVLQYALFSEIIWD